MNVLISIWDLPDLCNIFGLITSPQPQDIEKFLFRTNPGFLVLEVDFGNKFGIKTSSAKITHYYNPENLVGKQIIAVCNFPTKNIAGVESEVLVLGAMEEDGKVVLVHPSKKVTNGLKVI